MFFIRQKENRMIENIELIGENGENLKGEGLEKNGDFNVFSKTIKIYNKFKK